MAENFSLSSKIKFVGLLSCLFLIQSVAQAQVRAKQPSVSGAKARTVIQNSKSNSALLLAQNAKAAESSGQISAQVTQQPAPAKNWSLALGVDYNVSSVKEEAVEQETSLEYTINPSYSFSEKLSMSVLGSINQQRTGAKETLASDTVASLSYKGYQISESLALRHGVSALLPTSRKSQEEDRYKGGLRLSNGISLNLSPWFDATYMLGIQRNVHEFNVNQDGKANIQWQVRHQLDLGLHLTDSFSLKGMGRYSAGTTYENFNRYSFVTDVSAEYEIFKDFTASVGVGNDGPALKNNGVDSNISVYDEKSSTYHAGFGYTF